MNKTICFILLMILAFPVTANADFTPAEVQRLAEAKALLTDAEQRPVDEIMDELERTGFPQEHLLIYEAVAATFRDIQKEYGHDSPQSREQLLGKIRLNMAYFQLGGPAGEREGMGELNRLIRRKLKDYLPEDIWDHPELFHSLN